MAVWAGFGPWAVVWRSLVYMKLLVKMSSIVF